MNHWYFIVGAYGVTLIAMVVELVAVRIRHRNALDRSREDHAP